ncbi:hypothetical protein FKP32DRAFT_1608721 [Trametes sanguinea]|nr:hypothetical protein FKP32DRAFT_1608721 [Trametes sanguinea]
MVGSLPSEIGRSTYAEQLIIARNRHSYCVAEVSQGQHCLAANVVIFGQPVLKVYDVLPPPCEDIEECLAIFRIPFLVRHRRVLRTLQWLKLNHIDYENIMISRQNMEQYPEDEPPTGVSGEILVVYQSIPEHAVEDGPCSFIVYGLVGGDLVSMTYEEKKAYAIKYFDSGGKALSYGHDNSPQSI